VTVHSPAHTFLGVMGIVNVTPDSFSDGGKWMEPAAAIDHAMQLAAQGARFLDVGGESTRPGAARVPVEEQVRRVVPVIRGIRAQCDVPISVDTTRGEVAVAALDAGASIINDVASGDEGGTIALAAARRCGLVLMHRLQPPDRDSFSDQYQAPPHYEDVVAEVCAWLGARVQHALAAGVPRDRLWVDPGLGFGKTVGQNFELLDRVGEIVVLGFPVLISISRKSFIGARYGIADPAARDAVSAELASAAVRKGVAVVRAHDVAGHCAAISRAIA